MVLDTNVWLDLLRFRDPAAAALDAALATGELVAVVDRACREEWERVLAYPALGLDAPDRAWLIAAFDARSTRFDAPDACEPRVLPRCADADDQKFIALAHAAGARWLVSRDHAVLALARRCAREGLFEIVRPSFFAGGRTARA